MAQWRLPPAMQCPPCLSPWALSVPLWELGHPGLSCCFAELDCLPQSQSGSGSEILGDGWRDEAGRRGPGRGCPKSLPLCPWPPAQPAPAKPGAFYSGAPTAETPPLSPQKGRGPSAHLWLGKLGQTEAARRHVSRGSRVKRLEGMSRRRGHPRQTPKSSQGGQQAPASSLTMPAHR